MDEASLKTLSDKELETIFLKAYAAVSQTSFKFKQDTLLYFYAYYKKATDDTETMRITNIPINGEELVNAFKANALFQAKSMTKKEAKRKYILLAKNFVQF